MRYHLAHSRDIKKNRWNNRCPSCGQRKFSPYIDSHTGKPIDEKHCGRCCRERSCAYHMTPGEWFKEHKAPLLSPQGGKTSLQHHWLPREQYVELMRQRRKEAEEASLIDPLRSVTPCSTSLVPLEVGTVLSDSFIAEGQTKENCPSETGGRAECSINETERRGYDVKEYCERMSTLCTRTRSDKNHLARWLATRFPEEQVAEVLARYRTGSTRDGRIIYWQIDHRGQVRAGKVMAYDPDTGHRVKNSPSLIPPRGEAPGRDDRTPPPWGRLGGGQPVSWVHSIKIDGIRFDEMLVGQCLFGEHLAPLLSPQGGETPTAMSAPLPLGGGWEGALVESEKTALIMSIVKPDTVWLATGGKQNLKAAMLTPLIGLDVALYPDADALHQWYTRAVELNRTLGTRLHIPTWYYNLMDHDEARREGWDLADVVVRV